MTKFYQLDAAERRAQLAAEGSLSPADAAFLAGAVLPDAVADGLSENRIGKFALPLGVCRNLMVNGKMYQVPMTVEEPSVVAAASNGARIALANGGVQAQAPDVHLVIGEVVFADVGDLSGATAQLQAREQDIFAVANAAHPSIVRRGGGLKSVEIAPVAEFLKIRLGVDTQSAMGANIVNTIAEAVAHTISQWLGHSALVAILSNADAQVVTATVKLAPATLATKDHSGEAIAARIVQLSALAQVDVERAVTHNKGIMNGIEAAVQASGNDYRAVSATIHAYAARDGQYCGLSTWQMADGLLVGTLAVPMPVGVVGGAISALPAAQVVKRIGRYATVADLQQVLAALGLVQNLAALRALAGPGIQAGHMALAANALAMQAGAVDGEIQAVAQALQTMPKTLANAQAALLKIRQKG